MSGFLVPPVQFWSHSVPGPEIVRRGISGPGVPPIGDAGTEIRRGFEEGERAGIPGPEPRDLCPYPFRGARLEAEP